MSGRGLDSRRAGDRALWVLAVVCGLLLAADLFHDKHGHYLLESWFGFHGVFGALSIVLIVILGRWLRRIVMRDESYYD